MRVGWLMAGGSGIVLNREILAYEIRKFTRKQLPDAVDRIVRRSAFLVISELVKSLNGEEAGYPNPKRIDTGRYKAGWAMGLQQATGIRVNAPPSTDPKNPTQAGDGTGQTKGKGGLVTRIRIENNVKYGIYVEEGTIFMRPGNHLERAMFVAAADIRTAMGKAIPDAWNGHIYGDTLEVT